MERFLFNLAKTGPDQEQSSKSKMTSLNLSSSCPLLSSEASMDLIDSSTTKEEPYDPFVEFFGSNNTSGETVLYEAFTEIVRIAIFAYGNCDESCELISPGKIAIIFYPSIEEIRVILQPANNLWPVRNERIYEFQKFDYIGWLWRNDGRDRMCKKREQLGPSEKERGFVFGDWNYYGVAFDTEDKVLELNNVICSIQGRMSTNRIPRTNDLRDNFSLRVSRFWCDTGLRASNIKVICIHLGSVWRINGCYSVEHDRNGMIALVSRNLSPGLLEMLVIFRIKNGEEIDNVRKCYRVPETLGLVVSHIMPANKKDFIWEWAIGGDTWACAFGSLEDAGSFKKILDIYVNDLKKSSKKLFWKN